MSLETRVRKIAEAARRNFKQLERIQIRDIKARNSTIKAQYCVRLGGVARISASTTTSHATISLSGPRFSHHFVSCQMASPSESPQVPLLISPTSPFLADPSAVILDATWLYGAPSPSGDAFTEYLSKRIPRARFWSLDEMSEPNSDGFKYMLPSAERFARAAGEHGITKSSHVIIYDTQGAFSAPRTAFTFFVRVIRLLSPVLRRLRRRMVTKRCP